MLRLSQHRYQRRDGKFSKMKMKMMKTMDLLRWGEDCRWERRGSRGVSARECHQPLLEIVPAMLKIVPVIRLVGFNTCYFEFPRSQDRWQAFNYRVSFDVRCMA